MNSIEEATSSSAASSSSAVTEDVDIMQVEPEETDDQSRYGNDGCEDSDNEDADDAPEPTIFYTQEEVFERREDVLTGNDFVEQNNETQPATQPRGRARANQARWKEIGEELEFFIPDFEGSTGPQVGDRVIAEPKDALALFFDDEMMNVFVSMSNRYAHWLLSQPEFPKYMTGFRDVSLTELQGFFAVLLFMGISHLPNENMYWNEDESLFGSTFVKRTISRQRFKQIKRVFSVAMPSREQNAADKLAKVRSYLDMVKARCQKFYIPGRDVGLDESQILSCARNSRVSYRNPKKNKKPLKCYISSRKRFWILFQF